MNIPRSKIHQLKKASCTWKKKKKKKKRKKSCYNPWGETRSFNILFFFRWVRDYGSDSFTRHTFIAKGLLALRSSTHKIYFYRGPVLGWSTGLKMETVRFFNVTLWGIYRWLEIYRGLLTFESARWLTEISYPPFWKARGMELMEDSQEKDYSFLGFPNLYDALVYERKFKSEYLERQIHERSLKSEPSIVKPGETYRESKRTLIKPLIYFLCLNFWKQG